MPIDKIIKGYLGATKLISGEYNYQVLASGSNGNLYVTTQKKYRYVFVVAVSGNSSSNNISIGGNVTYLAGSSSFSGDTTVCWVGYIPDCPSGRAISISFAHNWGYRGGAIIGVCSYD